MKAELTERQRAFVAGFLDRGGRGFLNATRAAKAAGFAWPGKAGPRLTTYPTVHRAIEAGFQQLLAGPGRRGGR